MNTETQIEAKKQWLFVASAKGLQSYVFRSDPLMEMIGASELIERLPRENKASILESPPCEKKTSILKCALDEFAPAAEDYQVLTDASGTLRVLFGSKETAMRLARLWPVLAGQFAPGLEIAITVDEVADNLGEAIERAEYQINVNRNLLSADFPEAGPWVARNRRTGLPASRLVESLSSEDRGKRKEPVDGESKRKREAAEWAQSTLLRKVVPDGFELLLRNNPASRDVWPSDLTKLATSDNAYIAIIHADANGLGAAMMQCVEHLKAKTSKNAARDYSELCAAIEKSTQAAARKAMTPLLKQAKMELNPGRKAIVPVRPLVCAGEDFTCVIRAKYAVRFAHDFLCALEVETKNEFAGLSEPIHGLEKLTGCAGIVFFKSHYPFARAYAMAESLCGFAKKRTSRRASALAFLRLKNSLQPSDNYNEFIEHSFMGGPDGKKIQLTQNSMGGTVEKKVQLTQNPYLVGNRNGNNLNALAELRDLVETLNALPRSGLRNLVTRAYEGKMSCEQAFERLCFIVKERDLAKASGSPAFPAFESALHTLTGNGLWKEGDNGDNDQTPLYDALELLHLEVDLP